MANLLLDYIELTEYVPTELREQLTSIRELDLQVHNAMDEFERDFESFFSKINNLTPQERQEKYETFLRKCDDAARAASDKIKVADKLHDLVEKSMKYLDQGLEKLKEDLVEGDKAYIVEDLDRRHFEEMNEQRRSDQDALSKTNHTQHNKDTTRSSGSNNNNYNNTTNRTLELKSNHGHHGQSNHVNNHKHTQNTNTNNNHRHNSTSYRHSLPAHHQNHRHSNHANHSSAPNDTGSEHQKAAHYRRRNNSAGAQDAAGARQKKRERKRLSYNNTMTIFNRNSLRLDDDSSNQTHFSLSSPLIASSTPADPNSLPACLHADSNSTTISMSDAFGVVGGAGGAPNNNSNNNISNNTDIHATNSNSSTIINNSAMLKGVAMASSNSKGANFMMTTQNNTHNKNKSNGAMIDPLAGAKQPILTAIDAAHAVSPNASNSDKLVLFSSNSANGDKTRNHNLTTAATTHNNHVDVMNEGQPKQLHPPGHDQKQTPPNSNLLLTTANGFDVAAGGASLGIYNNHHRINPAQPFSNLPLSSKHDPIMVAASQAISATQSMAPGRRTSSLKASYAAVNSGYLPPTAVPAGHPQQQQFFDSMGAPKVPEIYCKCRSQKASDFIGCDSKTCKIAWYHFECVGITTPPEGEWFCDDCLAQQGIPKAKQPKLETKLDSTL